MGDFASRPTSPPANSNQTNMKLPIGRNYQYFGAAQPIQIDNNPMNRKFCEVLDNGSLNDIRALLNAYEPKPQVSNPVISFYLFINLAI